MASPVLSSALPTKVAELDRRATSAWSPFSGSQIPTEYSGLIAAGTVAGTVDVNFDSSSSLEILGF